MTAPTPQTYANAVWDRPITGSPGNTEAEVVLLHAHNHASNAAGAAGDIQQKVAALTTKVNTLTTKMDTALTELAEIKAAVTGE